MKLVILAGGRGTRLTEETLIKPKPLVDIGNKPIIWHIMKIYSHYGINDFIICLGYKGYLIKEYFANYFLHNSDLTIDLKKNSTTIHQKNSENWKVTLVDTGDDTLTGGRILKIKKYIKSDFLLTYGDGLSNVNINKLIHFHKNNQKLVTVTAIQPQGRFGIIDINKKNKVTNFKEKPKGDNNWINGGFFVLKPGIFNFLENESSVWEKKPLTELLRDLQNSNSKKQIPKPILLKIAPDLTDEQLLDIITIINETKIAGVIATNTTISRDGLQSENKTETGGLSGKPLTKRATEVIRFLSEQSNKAFPIIGVGGIHSAEDALEKLEAGASLIQLYTGFIYEGPSLVTKINKEILKRKSNTYFNQKPN